MRKVNAREYEGVLKSKNQNRLKYTINGICDSQRAYYCTAPNALIHKDNDSTDNYVILWAKEFFAVKFLEEHSMETSQLQQLRVHKFYREILPAWIKENIKILVCPNLQGEGCIMSAKEFRIALFLQLWEGEQEEWMFN